MFSVQLFKTDFFLLTLFGQNLSQQHMPVSFVKTVSVPMNAFGELIGEIKSNC